MSLNITRIIRRFRELTDVITTALTAGNNGKSMAMTWDNSGQTLTLTKDPVFDTVVLPAGQALPAATASKTYYVGTTGSDTTGDGSIGNPYATGNKAITVAAGIAWGEFIPTVQLLDGTYYENLDLIRVNANEVNIVGNNANPANVVINVSSQSGFNGRCIVAVDIYCRYTVSGITLIPNPSSGQCLSFFGTGKITFSNSLRLGAARFQFYVSSGAQVDLGSAAIELIGGGRNFLFALDGAIFKATNIVVTVNSAISYSDSVVNSSESIVTWTINNVVGSGSISGLTAIATAGSALSRFDGSGFGSGFSIQNSSIFGSQTNGYQDVITTKDAIIHGDFKVGSTVININTPNGATARAMPVYNSTGTLLGYIPIYSGLW